MVINNTSYAILPWGLVFYILNDVPDFLFCKFPVVHPVGWLLSEGPDLFMVVIVDLIYYPVGRRRPSLGLEFLSCLQ